MSSSKKQFCKNGHDTFIVGRTKGWCNICKKEYHEKYWAEYYEAHPKEKVQFCPKGHDTFICGRYSDSNCIECKKEYQLKYANEHIEEKRVSDKKWRENHRDEIKSRDLAYYLENKAELDAKKKEYREANPAIYKRILLKAKVNRGLRVVSWGREGMKEFYDNMPDGMTEDHIIPLCGEYVSGLHVRWNLQYMPRLDNIKKSNNITVEEATKFYEKILIEAGLK